MTEGEGTDGVTLHFKKPMNALEQGWYCRCCLCCLQERASTKWDSSVAQEACTKHGCVSAGLGACALLILDFWEELSALAAEPETTVMHVTVHRVEGLTTRASLCEL
jgi:hypothetical protein